MGETQQTGLADGNDFFWFFRIWRRVHRFFSSCNVKLTYLFASMREPHKRDLSRFVTVKEDQEEWNEKQLLIVKLAYARKKYALLMWLMILNTTNYIYGNHFLLVAMIIRLFLFFTFSCLKCVFGLTSSVFFIIQLSYFLPPLETTKFLRKYSENIERVRKELPKEYLSWAVVISCMCIVCCVSLCQWYMHAMWWNCRLYFFYWHRESIVSTLIPTTKTAYKQQKDIDL